jgi:hypothetical protein
MAIAALISWLITASFGSFMLATWVRNGGLRPAAGVSSNFPPARVFSHFLLAAAGLIVWIVYLVVDSTTVAWIAFADLIVVFVIGDVLVIRWNKDRRRRSASTSGDSTAGATAATDLAEQRIPFAAVIAHGTFATLTIILVLLTALGIGAS